MHGKQVGESSLKESTRELMRLFASHNFAIRSRAMVDHIDLGARYDQAKAQHRLEFAKLLKQRNHEYKMQHYKFVVKDTSGRVYLVGPNWGQP